MKLLAGKLTSRNKIKRSKNKKLWLPNQKRRNPLRKKLSRKNPPRKRRSQRKRNSSSFTAVSSGIGSGETDFFCPHPIYFFCPLPFRPFVLFALITSSIYFTHAATHDVASSGETNMPLESQSAVIKNLWAINPRKRTRRNLVKKKTKPARLTQRKARPKRPSPPLVKRSNRLLITVSPDFISERQFLFSLSLACNGVGSRLAT